MRKDEEGARTANLYRLGGGSTIGAAPHQQIPDCPSDGYQLVLKLRKVFCRLLRDGKLPIVWIESTFDADTKVGFGPRF
jgi:hypothetical protein